MKFCTSFVGSSLVTFLFLSFTPHCLSEYSNDYISLRHCCNDNGDCEKRNNRIEFNFTSKSIYFKFEKSATTCKGLERLVELDTSKGIWNQRTDVWTLPDLDKDSFFYLENGTYEISSLGSISPYLLFPENNYCVKKVNKTVVHFGICCTEKHPCIRKCCPPGERLTLEGKNNEEVECQPDNNVSLDPSQTGKKFKNYITGWVDCAGNPGVQEIKLPEGQSLKKSIGRNGNVVTYFNVRTNKWEHLNNSEDYCMDKTNERNECGGILPREYGVIFLCPSPESLKKPEALETLNFTSRENKSSTYDSLALGYSYIYIPCFIIAMLFSLATALVKFLLWEKQNIHSWTILCYVLSLFFLYLSLLIDNLPKSNVYQFTPGFCVFMGVTTHFCAFCAFGWLSVINFDLWWTFRVLTPVTESKLEFQRFLWYCAFAFFIPVLMTSVSLGLHVTYKESEVKCGLKNETIPYPSNLKITYPHYGKESCFLASSATLAYFYGPLGFLLLTNLIFYLTTTYRMFTLYKTSRRASETSSKKQRQSCRLFLKLFVVAGLTWSFEVIFYLAGGQPNKWYWVLLDMSNIFQAIAIFVIFVCKKETVRSLEQKYPSLKCSKLICNTAIFGPIARFTRSPNFQDRSTDGSTKISRTELSKNGVSESFQKQESIELS